jgi:SAM-dependent methyltransferase
VTEPPHDPDHGHPVSRRWTAWRRQVDLDAYDARFDHDEAHGEADLIASLGPASVLDAGCGTGRVAVELDRRGIEVVGVDLDPDLLDRARRRAPHVRWTCCDLASMDLGRTFDVVAMPGNVMVFCRRRDRGAVVAGCARHVAPGGALLTGFVLESLPGAVTLEEYDSAAAAAGLVLDSRWSTWERDPFDGDGYAVSLHRRPR